MTNRILLTGATGFLGTQLLRTLVAAGHEVVVLVRPRAGMTPAERVRRLVGPGGVRHRLLVTVPAAAAAHRLHHRPG